MAHQRAAQEIPGRKTNIFESSEKFNVIFAIARSAASIPSNSTAFSLFKFLALPSMKYLQFYLGKEHRISGIIVWLNDALYLRQVAFGMQFIQTWDRPNLSPISMVML